MRSVEYEVIVTTVYILVHSGHYHKGVHEDCRALYRELRNIYTMASRLISAISDPRPRYQPEAKPRADIEDEGLILLILT